MPTHRGDPDALLRSLRELDLSHLNAVAFKGGEPLLNPDLPATLKHLDAIGRLSQVTVRITTNGSVAPTELLPLLSKAKRCDIGISVDGAGELQTYIRHGRSSADNIARFVEAYRRLPRVRFGAIVSVMAYNVPALPQIEAWWSSVAG
jgi:sulfatase maturation enzyme AslB (radical SAM superfamily)